MSISTHIMAYATVVGYRGDQSVVGGILGHHHLISALDGAIVAIVTLENQQSAL